MTSTGTITQLLRLSKLVHKATPEAALGMTLRQFWALSVLAANDGWRSQHVLGQQLLVDANNLVLLLNELEDAGWVRRERDAEDRRRHIVVLTKAGREAFERAERAQNAAEDKVLAALGPQERKQLGALISKALES
jgi:DNA-binding MarR family transcriptional regulator